MTDAQRAAWTAEVDDRSGQAVPGFVRAFTLPDPDGGRCDIYAPAPTTYMGDDMAAVGHEFWHCVVGKFHGPAGDFPNHAGIVEARTRINAALGIPAD